MRRTPIAALGLVVAAIAVSGCGSAERPGAGRDGAGAATPRDGAGRGDAAPASGGSVAKTVARRPAERCRGAAGVDDPAGDTRPWLVPEPAGRPPTPAFADLLRFELHADAAGVCARWTTADVAPAGTTLVLNVQGPYVRRPGGGVVAHGHGFEVELLDRGGRVTYGRDSLRSNAPRELRARVGRSGRTVSAFVPRAELDRPPANMPDRPPFPYRAFFVEARVITPPDGRGGRDADFWPAEGAGQAGYVDGGLCAVPCRDVRLGFDAAAQAGG